MPTAAPPDEGLVALLEGLKTSYAARDRAAKHAALAALAGRTIRRAGLLRRFHEVLCFLRAYPDDAALLAQVEGALDGFERRLAALTPAGAAQLDESGVAGTTIYCPLSLAAARWLASRFPDAVEIDWDDPESEERVGALVPLAAGLVAEDALVEAGVPYRAWLTAAKGDDPRSDLAWLLARLGRAPATAALYDATALRTRWALRDSAASRTRARVPVARVFFHRGPLPRWRGSLARRLPGSPVAVRPAGPAEAARLLDTARAAVIVRYREVHGFNFADPADVRVADAGRGAGIAWFGLLPAHRLPLRAHYGYLLLKNGVPAGYGDASLLFDVVEVAFNVFETFRQGEAAFLFGRLLAFLYQHLGGRRFQLSRYQIGHRNAEALASGAFWFYYKLGFRPARAALRRLAAAERRRVAREPGYRSSRATLARLAGAEMLLGTGRGAAAAHAPLDARRVARAAVRLAAARGPALTAGLARTLGVAGWRRWPAAERRALAGWAPVLGLIPGLGAWPARERRGLRTLIRAKGRAPEAEYLARLRGHRRLRRSLLAALPPALNRAIGHRPSIRSLSLPGEGDGKRGAYSSPCSSSSRRSSSRPK